MISVRKQSGTAEVQQPALPSLAIIGGLFAMLGGLTVLGPPRPAAAWLSTLLLFAVAAALIAAGLRKERLCRLRRGEDAGGVRGVQRGLCVRWSRLDDSRVEVWADDAELFGGTRIVQVLQAAEVLASALDVPLSVETSLDDAVPRSTSAALAENTPRGQRWRLPHSGALRRAELAVWVVGALGALQMAILVVSESAAVETVHPLSISLAIGAPLCLLAVALGLRSREPRIDVGEHLSIESHFLGRCWQRTVFDRQRTTYTLLQHPRLDLGFVWLRSPNASLVLSSNAGAAAALAAYLTSHDVPDSKRDER